MPISAAGDRVIGEPCHVQQIPTYRFGLATAGRITPRFRLWPQPFELNAICALTPMRGSAALHVEQTPGTQDFAPLELAAGEVILFDHIDRLHGCPLNGRRVGGEH